MHTITVPNEAIPAHKLPMNGTDISGNRFEADNISLLKNGKRILPIMGEFHYSRYEPEDWKEELLKMKAGGIAIAATYVFWLHHEEKEGEWDFSGCRDLNLFLRICMETGLQVWLRIGPWAHGECRNGGFPDWVAHSDRFTARTNDPAYLEAAGRFYEQIANQVKGMMCKDGGPVLGIQIENEFGHCGGPADLEEGMRHMLLLKQMAVELGMKVPYYTATGWGGAYVPDGEFLPVLGGYVDAPWAEHTQEMPANSNFLFEAFKQDDTIGSDLKRAERPEYTFDIHRNPYLTAELGGGLQVTAHRRTYPWGADIEAQTLCMLGAGANLLGYYMYHGGINPEGKYSTLQESKATGYNNDLPVKSYDFQTCIRESGEIRDSYGRLNKLHLLIQDFEQELAGSHAYFPDTLDRPASPEDLDTLRYAVRHNHETGSGFLFISNHQRKRQMTAHRDFSVAVSLADEELIIPHLWIESGETAVIPYNLKTEAGMLKITNASLLCRLGDTCFFYTDREASFEWEGQPANTVVLTREQAAHAYKLNGRLYITSAGLTEDDGKVYLLSSNKEETVLTYTQDAVSEEMVLRHDDLQVTCGFENITAKEDEPAHSYRITLSTEADLMREWHQLYLEPAYAGDRAEVYVNGILADDWFTTGERWHIALKRFGYPRELILKIYPWKNGVYYDLPVEQGCALYDVQVVGEWKAVVPCTDRKRHGNDAPL